MTAPANNNATVVPWKIRWATIILAALALWLAPAQVGRVAGGVFNGITTAAEKIGDSIDLPPPPDTEARP